MRRVLLLLLVLLLPAVAWAQDKGFVASTLEQSLSGPGRTVTITGFAGVWSSKATMQQMTVADAKGVWLTLKGVTLDWSRAALLSGAVKVNELSADDIVLARLPESPPSAAPSAEAGGFSLPELPVSVDIGKILAKRVELGAPVLGQAAVLAVSGAMRLAGGEGSAKLDIHRIDGPRGVFSLAASYANASGQLSLDLSADEAAQGLITTLAGLPGAPAIALSVKGTGPLDDYRADIRLATDGEQRLTGAVTLKAAAQEGGTGPAPRQFTADLAGDISPLFAPDYRAFFGPDMQLAVKGSQVPGGALTLSALRLQARSVDLNGRLVIGADGLPKLMDIAGRIASQDGRPVLLPLPGVRTEIGGADLRMSFDAAKGEGWQGEARIQALNRPDFAASSLILSGSGTISPAGGGAVDGALKIAAEGLQPADAALAQALGRAVSGTIRFGWKQGAPLELPQLQLAGAGYGLDASGRVDGLGAALSVTGEARARINDLSRLSGLAGRPLGGAGQLRVKGTAALLAGSFDLDATVRGQDLRLGQPELDSLLRGQSRIVASVKRDESGTRIRSLDISASTLSAEASGLWKTGASDLSARLDFSDLAALGKRYGGALQAAVRYREAAGGGHLSLTGAASDLAIGQKEADRLMRGKTALELEASRDSGRIRVEKLVLDNPQLSLRATAQGKAVELSARLADLALLAPGFPGPLNVNGTVGQSGAGYAVKLAAAGPGGLKADVAGSVAGDFGTADLALKGGVDAGIVNGLIEPRSIRGPARFDLRLNGPPGLAALSGTVNLGPARLAAPVLGVAADPVTATVTLSAGRAQVAAKATVGGGTVTLDGPVRLAAPFPAELSAKLSNVLFKNPDLFSTRVSGALSVRGPLTGGARIAGALRLGQTEIRVPSTGFGGSAAIPDGLHFTDGTAAERATRVRAGLTRPAAMAESRAVPFGLDVTISAPNRVYIRGRGLDAELGGRVKLGGTTANVVPSGGFHLLRGRLDILGKRFDLSQASLQLEGRFVPFVQIAASSENDGVTSTISIQGEASDPKISFSSSPPLPESEVLSHLLFGKGLNKISALQAAQLASAVATLAGKGGEGIIGKLRGGFGLDNLDVQSGENGGAEVKAGKYLSRRIYTEVTVGSDGKSSVSLNLDVTKSVTVKGTAGSDGSTGIGVFLQRDY
jgi:translocation and assembly module TamB